MKFDEFEEPKKIERLSPNSGELINTYCDCPYRDENIHTLETILHPRSDYSKGLCPDRCPVSPRNADYSLCCYNEFKPHVIVNGCRVGSGGWSIASYWCEAAVVSGICPLQFTR
jgi:hypothetical protein